MKTIITNAFSINMLPRERRNISFKPLTIEEAREFAADGATSAVGHADTAAVFSTVLGLPVEANRVNVTLEQHETRLLVGQYRGPRLEAGATMLPKEASIEWWLVV